MTQLDDGNYHKFGYYEYTGSNYKADMAALESEPRNIASITMLGDGKELKWEMTKEGMVIETPDTKSCDYAFVYKIVRERP